MYDSALELLKIVQNYDWERKTHVLGAETLAVNLNESCEFWFVMFQQQN